MDRRKHNRRKDIRVPEENRVLVGPAGAPPADRVHAFTRDLSVGGAQLETDRPYPVGTDLAVSIILSKSRQMVEVRATVKWIKEVEPGLFALGVEFRHSAPHNLLLLIGHLFRKTNDIGTIQRD